MHRQLILLFLLCWLLTITYVQANESRVALVIGNAAYTNLNPLANPVNDARDMAAKLRQRGFEVVEYHDVHIQQIGSILREFRSKLKPGGVALVFYAGHGMQIKGENYLPAVGEAIKTEEDVPNQSISVRQIMDVLEDSKTMLNLVFLDACRNNPFVGKFRSGERGLARMIIAPSGTLISYATRPGTLADDGEGRNGLYTGELLKQLDSSQPIEQSIKTIVREVKKISNGEQEPWIEGSIEGDFCFAVCSSSAPADPLLSVEVSFWNSIKDSQNPADFLAYLKKYPQGQFEALAHNRLEDTKAKAPRIATVAELESKSETNPRIPVALESTQQKLLEIKEALLKNMTSFKKHCSETFLRSSAKDNNPLAQNLWGLCHSWRWGVTQDEAEAMRWYRKAAEQDNSDGQVSLGNAYSNGEGVTQDKAEAVRWYRKAAEQGNAGGQVNLGQMYKYGKGLAQDEAEAVRWYRKAAEQGNTAGQVNLGQMYKYGKGVAQDEAEAVRWYRKAAEQGNTAGQVNLGNAYSNGEGVTQDKAEAVRWYRKAAEQGYAAGQYALGRAYEIGDGVTQNKSEAMSWYTKAAALGDELAKNRLVALRTKQLLANGKFVYASKALKPIPFVSNDIWQTIGHYLVKDGLVKDTKTGLMWMRCSLGQQWDGSTCHGESTIYKWQEAMATPQGYQYGGYNDWRVPTIKELKTLIYCSSRQYGSGYGSSTCIGDYESPTIMPSAFPATPPRVFWSSSINGAFKGYVGFDWGIDAYGTQDESDTIRTIIGLVRLVRHD